MQPDRKLMVDTVSKCSTSRTGLMMTPPPMPQMAPATLANRLTRKNRSILPLLSCGYAPYVSSSRKIDRAATPFAPLRRSGSTKTSSVRERMMPHRFLCTTSASALRFSPF